MGPRWCGQRPCILLLRFEFQFQRSLRLYSVKLCKKNENKRKRDRGWPKRLHRAIFNFLYLSLQRCLQYLGICRVLFQQTKGEQVHGALQ